MHPHARVADACITPAFSPRSDGRTAASVKSFERDHVHVHVYRRDGAASVMQKLQAPFDDGNERHPYRGLGMRSPRAYRRLRSTA